VRRSRKLSVIGICMSLITVVAVAGLLNFYWSGTYVVDTDNFLYVDDALATETTHSITATLTPGECCSETHTIRLDETAPTSFLTVGFTITITPDDGGLTCEVQDSNGDPVTSMDVVPASEVNAQEYTVVLCMDPLAEPGVSYTVDVEIGYSGIGY